MDLTLEERVILDRFEEKCRMAGGPRSGYMLRKRAILYIRDDHPDLDLERGLEALRQKEMLVASEKGDLIYLTEAGAEKLKARRQG